MTPTSNLVHHPSGTYSEFSITPIASDPDSQVSDTIAVMARYATEDAASSQIRTEARTAMSESKGGDPVEAVWGYVKSRMHFVEDYVSGAAVQELSTTPGEVVEVLVRPRDMSTWFQGDCDDYVTYGASLLIALGVTPKFVTVAADATMPDEYSHVYLVVYAADGTRIPLDLSHGKYIGWETDNRFGKRREWVVSNPTSIAVVVGLGALVALGMLKRRGHRA